MPESPFFDQEVVNMTRSAPAGPGWSSQTPRHCCFLQRLIRTRQELTAFSDLRSFLERIFLATEDGTLALIRPLCPYLEEEGDELKVTQLICGRARTRENLFQLTSPINSYSVRMEMAGPRDSKDVDKD